MTTTQYAGLAIGFGALLAAARALVLLVLAGLAWVGSEVLARVHLWRLNRRDAARIARGEQP